VSKRRRSVYAKRNGVLSNEEHVERSVVIQQHFIGNKYIIRTLFSTVGTFVHVFKFSRIPKIHELFRPDVWLINRITLYWHNISVS